MIEKEEFINLIAANAIRVNNEFVVEQERLLKLARSYIETYSVALQNYVNKEQDALKRIEYSKLHPQEQEKIIKNQLEGQFEEIVKHKQFKDLEISGSTVNIYTKDLYLYNSAKTQRALLGQFKISFDVASRSLNIRNLTNRSSQGYHHPHIFTDTGHQGICWANTQTILDRMKAQRDLGGLFNLLIRFLETYNDNPGYPYNAGAVHWTDKYEPVPKVKVRAKRRAPAKKKIEAKDKVIKAARKVKT